MKTILAVLTLTAALTAQGAMPVIDVSVLAQAIEDVRLATEQLEQLRTQVKRLGDPATIRPNSAREVIRSLGMMGVGVPLDALQASASGVDGAAYDGNGLYLPPGEVITTPDGRAFPRPVQDYRKYDAVTRARTALEEVMADTEQRRQQMRSQISDTTGRLRAATTMAEVAKLQAVLAAQSAELAAIDREREAALARVLTQKIQNDTDQARQEQARIEERIVDFRAASEKLGKFLTPDTSPVRIPNPRGNRH